jgi:hypothetical protein
MKINIILCNCSGLNKRFEKMDMNTLPFQIECDLDVQYTIVHPQLCGKGGNTMLEQLLKGVPEDTYVIVGGCAPDIQRQLLGGALERANFPAERLISVDIRGKDNDQSYATILGKISELLEMRGEPQTVDSFGG